MPASSSAFAKQVWACSSSLDARRSQSAFEALVIRCPGIPCIRSVRQAPRPSRPQAARCVEGDIRAKMRDLRSDLQGIAYAKRAPI